jgi:ABC-type Fe3+/spermidine/putrescine transport system ATPase subunit
MLELKHISKTYEGKPLLIDISFTLEPDETICLLGSSGSGKSTLLRMIAGLETPDSGSILFNGMDLAQTPPHLRDFGLVFQDYGLFPHLNVFENVAFGLRMKNMESKSLLFDKRRQTIELQSRVDELLEQVNLSGFASRKVTDLSGGEQQRIALARALATSPRLLMFDEPLGALDRSLKEDLLNELRGILRRTKIPAIYVTHDQEEAFAIADRILLLHDGLIIRSGKPEEIWQNPGSAFAAKFFAIGNVVSARMKAEGGRMKAETEFGLFSLDCKHNHQAGEMIDVLLKPSGEGGEEIQITAEDVLFDREQFRVKSRGGVFFVNERPRVGEIIRVRVKVECLA